MRKLQVVTLLTIFLVAMSASSLFAQRRPGRAGKTGSARAAYGFSTERYQAKKKKAKKKKKQHKSPNKDAAPRDRKRSPWVN